MGSARIQSPGAEAFPRRAVARTVVGVAAVVAAAVAIDRLALPDVLPAGEGQLLYRARVVPPPVADAGGQQEAVFVRPLAGPECGQRLSAAPLPDVPVHSLAGRDVFIEFRQEGAVVSGIARDRGLLYLAALLVGLIVLVAAGSSWRLLGVLFLGAAALLGALVPLLLAGVPPILAAAATAMAFLAVACVLVGKTGRRALAILAGSAGGLAAALLLSVLAVRLGRLTGVYSPLTKTLWFAQPTGGMDFAQLLSAGIIVGACGIILDLAVAVASAVHEVARADPHLGRRQLAAAGLAVGRDVMGTELNTLIFAYAGAHFGVLLLPMLSGAVAGHEVPALRVFSQQDVAIEVLAMAVGSSALVLTIPITAAAAATLTARRGRPAGPTPPPGGVSARAGRWRWAVVPAVLLLAWLAATWWHSRQYHRYAAPAAGPPRPARYLVQAEVRSVDPPASALDAAAGRLQREQIQRARCTLTSGPQRGADLQVANAISGFPGHDKLLRAGDRVLLQTWVRDGRVSYGAIIDFSRGPWLIHFVFLLAALVLVVGRAKGLRALAALAVCAAVLYPAVLAVGTRGFHWPALPTFLIAAAPLCVGVFLILAGPSAKAAAGSAGAFGGLLAGGLCALAAARALAFSGLQSDAMVAIRNFTGAHLDYRGLLQAGMVLGIAGAAMDVAIAIASAVGEVLRVKPSAGRRELFASGLRVGRGVMIPMVLVLLFAYVGLSLPILMLPKLRAEQHLSLLISNERVSVEILRILVGGIGVVCTVPVTAAAAAALARRGTRKRVR